MTPFTINKYRFNEWAMVSCSAYKTPDRYTLLPGNPRIYT